MSKQEKLNKGDWIAFQRAGKITIGKIEYMKRDILGYWQYITTAGQVREDSVLEVRP